MIIDRIVQSNREPDKHALWRKNNSLYYFSNKGWEEINFFPSLDYNSEDPKIQQELENLKNKYAISNLVERKKVVVKEKEPDKNVLWLQDNVIKEMSPSGWNNIAKSSSLEELNDAIKRLEDYSCIELVFIKEIDPRKCVVSMIVDNKLVTITLPEGTPQYYTYRIEKPSASFYLGTSGIRFEDEASHTQYPEGIAYYNIRKDPYDYIEEDRTTTTWPPERLNINSVIEVNGISPTKKFFIYVDRVMTTTTSSTTSTLSKDIRVHNMTPYKAKIVIKSGSNKVNELYLQPGRWHPLIKRGADYKYEVQLLHENNSVVEISYSERFGIDWGYEKLESFTFSDSTDTIKFELSYFREDHSNNVDEFYIVEHTLTTTTTTTTTSTTSTTTTTTKPKTGLVVKIINNTTRSEINPTNLHIGMDAKTYDYDIVLPGIARMVVLDPKAYHNVRIKQLSGNFVIENVQLISSTGDVTSATYYEEFGAYYVQHSESDPGLQIIEVLITN